MPSSLKNRFLEALPEQSSSRLWTQLKAVSLSAGTVLYKPGSPLRHVHFITSGLASIVATMEEGNSVEVAMTGYEGFPEAIHLLGPLAATQTATMQVEGTALQMSYQLFEQQMQEIAPMKKLLLQQVQYQAMTCAQIAACNALHDVDERLARWLLMVQDRIGTAELPLTQEFLGQMLGTRRSSVTIAAGHLQRAGLIQYRRGSIRIEDRANLEDVACECYAITRGLLNRLYQ